ncbi:MAG TPA: zinc-binding dehydrogenase [Kineosporiaceae bacterium]|nr:zinc-binding dehydrogenase [Kineosporiaceae bacterium]
MHAVVLHEFGPAENLRYESVEDPKPGPKQVRIAVRAVGVHLIDTGIRAGRPGGPGPTPVLPMIGGREVAGVVDEVGADVDASWRGRRVVAHLGMLGAGYAELAVADAGSLHDLPEGVDEAAAVAMIGTGRTAFAILERAQLSSDDVVLVTSAAGGLGVLLIQAALDAGAVVIGAAGGPDKVDLVRQLGATVAVDYDQADWADSVRTALDGRHVSLVLDAIGGVRGRAALELLGVDGRFLVYGFSSGEPTPLSVYDLVGRGITASAAIGVRLLQRPGGFRGLEEAALAALTEGRLVPLLTKFPLAEAAVAHAALENRQTIGKVVLIP